MATHSTSADLSLRSVAVGGNKKAICKCGEGWKCVISRSRSQGPDVGTPFYKCGQDCSCVLDEDGSVKAEVEKLGPNDAYCECGEGWSCVISRIEGPEPEKRFIECADGCTCVSKA